MFTQTALAYLLLRAAGKLLGEIVHFISIMDLLDLKFCGTARVDESLSSYE